MEDIKFAHLSDVDEKHFIRLMNNDLVKAQMPLLSDGFSAQQCRAFLDSKNQLWQEHGYGPWAFLIKGEFAGWGGVQPEHGETDFALVLDPAFWGWGFRIFKKIKDHAFKNLKLGSITVLFPPSRLNSKAITRLGFAEDGELIIDGNLFLRFRLLNPLA